MFHVVAEEVSCLRFHVSCSMHQGLILQCLTPGNFAMFLTTASNYTNMKRETIF